MAYSALVFPILVMALITVWRSASLVRAFSVIFIWTFALVLLTQWMGAYSPESAMVNGTTAGTLTAGMWWLLQRRVRLGETGGTGTRRLRLALRQSFNARLFQPVREPLLHVLEPDPVVELTRRVPVQHR